MLGDIGDLQALGVRLVWLLMTSAALLCMLQHHASAQGPARRCRAGLFDCSLPAWPRGAWRDARQWATLIAGLSMLPTMAALPLMADWCRSESVAPGAMVFMHLGAMFAPALLLRSAIAAGSPRRLSTLCAVGLGAGAAAAIWLPAPWHLLGLAFAQGAAWSLAWAGQLWAPDRRSRANSSPLRAAIGYAALTLAFGALVSQFGARGVIAAHVTLGVAAVLAWLWAWALPHSDVSAAAADPVRAIR